MAEEFINAIDKYLKNSNLPKWRIALSVDLHPSDFSKAMNKKTILDGTSKKIEKIASLIDYTGNMFDKPQGQPGDQIVFPSVHRKRK